MPQPDGPTITANCLSGTVIVDIIEGDERRPAAPGKVNRTLRIDSLDSPQSAQANSHRRKLRKARSMAMPEDADDGIARKITSTGSRASPSG